MKKVFLGFGLILLFMSCVNLAIGSQVADVAKKEKERRNKIIAPGKVFTNADIAAFKAKQGDTSSNVAEGTESSDDNPPDYDVSLPPDSHSPENEKYWKDRMQQATDHLQQLQSKADDLQKTISGLMLNVTNYDGVVAGPQLNAQLGEMKDQLESTKEEIKSANQAIEDLQEEARKAGVPPGWMREQ